MAVATNAAAAKVKAFPPPSSAFGELLRRSRFASYDPTIAQAYTSPQAHARRGDYGLKRPIPMPYKDSYVTVNRFEHHAQFTEWNNADAMVKFVKRVEETNINPRPYPNKDWDRSLGEARTQWLMDSEFAENTERQPTDGLGRRGEGAYGARRPPPQQYHTDTTSTTVSGNTPQVNVLSLSPRQFKRYLAKLRHLSPEFREHLLEQQKARFALNLQEESTSSSLPSNPQPKKKVQQEFQEDDAVLFIASQSQFHPHKFHRPFLAKHFSASSSPISTNKNKKITTPTVAVSENIEPQPHRTGALMYSHYSPLETVLTARPQPGFLFQDEATATSPFTRIQNKNQKKNYIALIGGLMAHVKTEHGGSRLPFYNPGHDVAVGGRDVKAEADAAAAAALAAERAEGDEDAAAEISTVSTSTEKSTPLEVKPPDADDPLRIKGAIGKFRILGIALRSPPTTISTYKSHTSNPKDILKSIGVSPDASVDFEMHERYAGGNPYRIGSMEYSGHVAYDPRHRFQRMTEENQSYLGYGGVYGTGVAGTGTGMGGPTAAPTLEGAKPESFYFGVSYSKPEAPSSGVLEGVVDRGTKYGKQVPAWNGVFGKDGARKTSGEKYGSTYVPGGYRAVRNEGVERSVEDGEDTKRALEDMVRNSGSGGRANGKGRV